MIVAFIVLIFSLCCLFWIYFGYGFFISLLSKFYKKKVKVSENFRPTVTMLIIAYNEEVSLKNKIINSLQINYPRNLLEILVIDSNSTDQTRQIAESFSNQGIKYLNQGKREGKASALHFGIKNAKNDIIVSTDANAFFDSEALLQVVKYFDNKLVGGVTASMHQKISTESAIQKSSESYWKTEKKLRFNEAQIASVIGMSGEFSAFLKKIFIGVSLADWYVGGGPDDLCLSLYIIRHGFRIAYAEKADVWEKAPNNIKDFFSQKVRIIVQTIAVVFKKPKLVFSPLSVYSLLIYPSRKILPLFSPLFIILVLTLGFFFLSNFPLVIINDIIFMLVLIVLFGILLAFLLKKYMNIFSNIFLFALLNIAVIWGWLKYLNKTDYSIWEKIESSRT